MSIARRVAAHYRAQTLHARVAARYVERQADQIPGQRRETQKNVTPINKPLNVPPQIKREQAQEHPPEDGIKPERKDIRPKDVFNVTPNDVGVRNFAETGRDNQTGKVDRRIKDDAGFATVKNLSQYLIRTEGGGGTPPQGR